MEGIEHKTITVNGLNMHTAEKGQGPVILFLHGFPELWYSWRHQINYVAAHGYRAVAPDLRGYGDTTGAPTGDFTKFTVLHVVGDIVALIDAISPDAHQVFVVGHDWGAYIAWFLSLFRPDRVKALVNLSVQFHPRNPAIKPVDLFRRFYGDDHYICRFQVLSYTHTHCTYLLMGDSIRSNLLRPNFIFYWENFISVGQRESNITFMSQNLNIKSIEWKEDF